MNRFARRLSATLDCSVNEVIEPYRKEFDELTALAEKHLQYPEVHLPHHKKLFRIWRYPSFEPYVSWIVFAPVERYANLDLPMVVEISWHRPFDALRFHDPMKGLAHGFSISPAVDLRQAELLPSQIEWRMTNLETIQIPLLIDESIGVDGESFGFETYGFAAIRLTWSSLMPESWKAIVEWAKETREFLSESLERKSLKTNAI